MNEATTRHGRTTAGARGHSEGMLARAIEGRAAGLPSGAWPWAASAPMGASLALHAGGKRHESLFIGQRAAPSLLPGVYNKLVKVAGSGRVHAP